MRLVSTWIRPISRVPARLLGSLSRLGTLRPLRIVPLGTLVATALVVAVIVGAHVTVPRNGGFAPRIELHGPTGEVWT
jgi:hypothetical protein